MKRLPLLIAAAIAFAPMAARAALPVTPAPDQAALLTSPDPKLAANKKLVYDMWRAILLGGHVEMAEQYFAPDYMQHNPMVDTGRDAMVKFFSTRPKKDIPPTIPGLVSVVAERDRVVMSFVRELKRPDDPTKTYTTTWFDMFRIQNGKIQEHWDVAMLPAPPPPKPAQ